MIESRKKRVAILVADGFEQSHMVRPRRALENAGASTYLVCGDPLLAVSWAEGDYSEPHVVDKILEEIQMDDFDSLLLPGGIISIDSLRQEPEAIAFINHFFAAGKPVAAIGHGAQILIDATCLQNRIVTSVPSIRRDLENAGAVWKHSPVVFDANLLTAQSTDNFTDYASRFVQHFFKGSRARAISNALAA